MILFLIEYFDCLLNSPSFNSCS